MCPRICRSVISFCPLVDSHMDIPDRWLNPCCQVPQVDVTMHAIDRHIVLSRQLPRKQGLQMRLGMNIGEETPVLTTLDTLDNLGKYVWVWFYELMGWRDCLRNKLLLVQSDL